MASQITRVTPSSSSPALKSTHTASISSSTANVNKETSTRKTLDEIRNSKEELQSVLDMHHGNVKQTADYLQTKPANIWRWMKDKNIKPLGPQSKFDPNIAQSLLTQFDGNVSAVAQKLDVHKTTLYKWMGKNNITNVGAAARTIKPSAEKLQEHLQQFNWNVPDVANELGASASAVWEWMAEHKLKKPTEEGPGKAEVEKALKESNNHVVTAARQKLHVSPKYLYKLIKDYGIVRPPKERKVKQKKMRVGSLFRHLYLTGLKKQPATQIGNNTTQSQNTGIPKAEEESTQGGAQSTGTNSSATQGNQASLGPSLPHSEPKKNADGVPNESQNVSPMQGAGTLWDSIKEHLSKIDPQQVLGATGVGTGLAATLNALESAAAPASSIFGSLAGPGNALVRNAANLDSGNSA